MITATRGQAAETTAWSPRTYRTEVVMRGTSQRADVGQAMPSANAGQIPYLAYGPSLTFTVEPDGDWFLAVAAEVPMFGEGPTAAEAVADLLHSLITLRSELRSEPGELSAELAEQLRVLESALQR